MGDKATSAGDFDDSESSYFKAIFDHAPVGIGLLDGDGRTILSNPLLQELMGYTAEELRNLDYNTLAHPGDVEPNATLFTELMEGRKDRFSVDKRFYRKDGRLIWVRVTVSSVPDEKGRPRYALGLLEDITERRSQDERYSELLGKLSQAEALFELAFRNAGFGMDLTDDSGRFLQVNRALCRIMGYSEEELLSMRWQDLTYPEDLPDSEQRLYETFEGSDVVEFTKRYVHSSGRVLWCVLNSSLVRDADGEPLYAVSQIHDITRQRELEQQLRHSYKMEAVGRLAGGIAHDFNNLLLVINNYAQMLRDDMEESDERRADLEEIVAAGTRAAHLVQQLLAFSRRDTSTPQSLSFNEVIEGLLELLRRTLGSDINLELDLAPDLLPARMDVSEAEQILVNLAVNARAAMPSGGTLEVRTANATVAEGDPTLSPGRYVQLTLTDDGEGIDPSVLPKLFEPFFTTKGRGEATGLGLATVYGIVEQAGGSVTARSEPGEGATFMILLPALDGDTDASRS